MDETGYDCMVMELTNYICRISHQETSATAGPTRGDHKHGGGPTSLAVMFFCRPKGASEECDRMWKGNRKPYNKTQLERRAQALQVESTLLSTQLMQMQNDIIGLIAENSEMKLYVQSIKQQIHFQDALNDALKEEINWLRIATSQMSSNDGAVPMMNLGEPSYEELQQFYHHHSQGRQLQILPQHQLTPEGHNPLLQPTLDLQQQLQALGDLRMKGPLVSQTMRHEKRFDHNNNNGSYNN